MTRIAGRDQRAAAALQPRRILYGIYAGRLVVCLGVYGPALLLGNVWAARGIELAAGARFVAMGGLVVAAVATALAYWHSYVHARPLGVRFILSQATVDVLLVTGVVHVTGGFESPFPALLYISLATAYALVLPFMLALALALGTGLAYLFDLALWYSTEVDSLIILQIAIFTLVACATSMIGSRLRQVGQELRLVEGELARLRLDTADILRTITSGVVTLDARGTVFYMNPTAAKLLGVEIEEWLERDLLAELDGRAPGVAYVIRKTLATDADIKDYETEIFPEPLPRPPREGALRPLRPLRPGVRDALPYLSERPAEVPIGIPVSASTTILRRPEAPPSLTLHLQDLRMARQLEEMRFRSGRLEAVAELSASLAHELKNPLASIRSAVEQLSAREAADEDDRRLGRLIVQESDRLDRVLREFGDFARVDVSEREPVDLAALVGHVAELVRQHPAAERAEVDWSVEDDVRDLWGDAELLQRTLLNLVLNAVQVGTEEGRHVHVEVVADSLQPSLVPPDPSLGLPVRIRVIDDGPGIPAQDLPRIFDPFYTRRRGGSGLGLSIAHRAVQAHGGALLVTSTVGAGTTFQVVLPRRAREERDESETRSGPVLMEGAAAGNATR